MQGNYPDSVVLEVADIKAEYPADRAALLAARCPHWRPLLPAAKLGPHRLHELAVAGRGTRATHCRVTIAPDGGISRLRLIGYPDK